MCTETRQAIRGPLDDIPRPERASVAPCVSCADSFGRTGRTDLSQLRRPLTCLQTTDDITGQFDNVADGQRLATIDGTGSFVVTYTRNDIFLSGFLLGIPGDYNQNGTVDAADYTIWRDHLGQTFTLTNENPNAATPGAVDAEDYAFWKPHFGEIAGGGPGSGANAAVPEPTSRVLFMTGVLVMFVCRRVAVS